MYPGVFSIGPRRRRGIDLRKVEQNLQAAYRKVHVQYRRDDELEVNTSHHRRLALILEQITSSFGHPISVLDMGCGTGRYFHCLKNVERLVGVDLSPEMLQAAQVPVRQGEISAEKIELFQANAHLVSLPAESFDFIYSLGMFGHGCPVTVDLCNKFCSLLKPGGTLFFNVLELRTLAVVIRMRNKAGRWLRALIPEHWQRALEERRPQVPFYGLTKRGLTSVLRASHFRQFTIFNLRCRSPLWKGIHLECEALKEAA